MESLVLQVGARQGRVAELARSQDGELSVGRAFSNDLVLTDQHVAPQQLRCFKHDSTWRVQILDRTNPVLLNKRIVTEEIVDIAAGDELTVGRTRLQVFSSDQAVEPTRKLMVSNWLALENTGPFLPLLVLLGTGAIDLVINFYLGSTSLKWLEHTYTILFSMLICVGWAGVWAIAGRILRHQHHFGLQLIIAAIISFLMTFLTLGIQYITFYTFSADAEAIANWLIYAIALVVLFRLNYLIATNVQRPLLAAVISTGLLLGTIYGFYYPWGGEELEYDPTHSQLLLPPGLMLSDGVDAQQYFSDLTEEFNTLESE